MIEVRHDAILTAAAKVEEPVTADQAPNTPTPIADRIFRYFLSA